MKKVLLILFACAQLVPVSTAQAAYFNSCNALVKGPGPTVYWVSADCKRYSFPNANTYYTWFPDFTNITQTDQVTLDTFPLVGQMTYRPGAKLIKLPSDPKVYEVGRYGVLRWVTSEYLANRVHGPAWKSQLQDLPESLFYTYSLGSPIYNEWDFNVGNEYNGVKNPNDAISFSGPLMPLANSSFGALQLRIDERYSPPGSNGLEETLGFTAQTSNQSSVPISIQIFDRDVPQRLLAFCDHTTRCSFAEDFGVKASYTYIARAYDASGAYVESAPLSFNAGGGWTGPIYNTFVSTSVDQSTMSSSGQSVTVQGLVTHPRLGGQPIYSTVFDITIRDTAGNVLKFCPNTAMNLPCAYSAFVSTPSNTTKRFVISATSRDGVPVIPGVANVYAP